MGVFTGTDSYYFHQGTNYEVYQKMGAHPGKENGKNGTRFVVWAPNAREVAVITDADDWEREYPMERGDSVWEVFIPGVKEGAAYRYVITGPDGMKRQKSDPYAFTAAAV